MTHDQAPALWRKSIRSQAATNCVEVAYQPYDGSRAVRDSKDPSGPALRFGAAQWAAFTAGVLAGEFG